MLVKEVSTIDFMGNFYTYIKSDDVSQFVVGRSLSVGSEFNAEEHQDIFSKEIYLYEYTGNTLKKNRRVIIPDSYAIDAGLYLYTLCKNIYEGSDFTACIISITHPLEEEWVMYVENMFIKEKTKILKIFRGSYSIHVNSQYDIKWNEFTDIKDNIDLLELIVSPKSKYQEIQYAVLGGNIVGFGVWK